MDPNHPRPPVHPSTPPPPHILKMWKEKEKEKQKEKEKEKAKEKQKKQKEKQKVKRARRDTALRFYGKKHGRIWLGPLDPGLFMPCDARPDGP